MEDYNKSRSYGNGQMMQIESYYGALRPYDLRSYSHSHAQSQMAPKDMKLKKGKSMFKSWSIADPEFQRKKRIANYIMYSVDGRSKVPSGRGSGSLRLSTLRWFMTGVDLVLDYIAAA